MNEISITSHHDPKLYCTYFTATRSDGVYVNYQVADWIVKRSDWADIAYDIIKSLLALFRLYDEHYTEDDRVQLGSKS